MKKKFYNLGARSLDRNLIASILGDFVDFLFQICLSVWINFQDKQLCHFHSASFLNRGQILDEKFIPLGENIFLKTEL